PPRLRRLRLRQLWDRLWWLRRVGWLRRVRRRRVVLVARPSHLVRLVKRSFISDPASSAWLCVSKRGLRTTSFSMRCPAWAWLGREGLGLGSFSEGLPIRLRTASPTLARPF